MATIYKVDSKEYFRGLIDYLTKKSCLWSEMVYDNNVDMIDYVWELYENDLGIRVSEDNIMCDGPFSMMVEKSSDNDTIIKVLQEVHDKVIEEDFHSTVQELESLTRMVPDLWYSDLSLDDWYEHLEEMRDCSSHLTELLDDNCMRLAGLLSKGKYNS